MFQEQILMEMNANSETPKRNQTPLGDQWNVGQPNQASCDKRFVECPESRLNLKIRLATEELDGADCNDGSSGSSPVTKQLTSTPFWRQKKQRVKRPGVKSKIYEWKPSAKRWKLNFVREYNQSYNPCS
jgi:hypothetical protein